MDGAEHEGILESVLFASTTSNNFCFRLSIKWTSLASASEFGATVSSQIFCKAPGLFMLNGMTCALLSSPLIALAYLNQNPGSICPVMSLCLLCLLMTSLCGIRWRTAQSISLVCPRVILDNPGRSGLAKISTFSNTYEGEIIIIITFSPSPLSIMKLSDVFFQRN